MHINIKRWTIIALPVKLLASQLLQYHICNSLNPPIIFRFSVERNSLHKHTIIEMEIFRLFIVFQMTILLSKNMTKSNKIKKNLI